MIPEHVRCWAEISGSAIRHNLQQMREAGKIQAILAVIKANAYGHGLPEIAGLLANEVQMFGVANLDEAFVVNEAAPETPILLLSPLLPSERKEALRKKFIPWVSSPAEAQAYHEIARELRQIAEIHLKFDTGMGRLGASEPEAAHLIKVASTLPCLSIDGVSTHFSSADENREITEEQAKRFDAILRSMRPLPRWRHIQNSAGLLGYRFEGVNLARVGLGIYGISPLPDLQNLLQPILTWKTRVTLCRDLEPGQTVSYGRTFSTIRKTRIATLAVGYADGYQRHLSNTGASVLIRGHRCPILGRVTMDQLVVDITDVAGVDPGEEAVLLGSQGGDTILASELAHRAGTIAWEIFTGIGQRVRRFVV